MCVCVCVLVRVRVYVFVCPHGCVYLCGLVRRSGRSDVRARSHCFRMNGAGWVTLCLNCVFMCGCVCVRVWCVFLHVCAVCASMCVLDGVRPVVFFVRAPLLA